MTEEERKAVERKFQGARNRKAGEIFEAMLESSLDWYRQQGLMDVKKTPEPMKPIRSSGKPGQFLAHFVKPAQVDFSGTLAGGRAIRFEAKQTDTDRFTRDRLTPEQLGDLARHHSLGAYCCVMICFGFDHAYRIPWVVWNDMKAVFGRQYVKEEDVKMFRIPVIRGMFRLLGENEEEKYTDIYGGS